MEQESTRPVINAVSDDFKFSASAGKDYKPAPVKKLLKANVHDIQMTEQVDNYKTTPDGKPNPTFGQAKTVFIWGFKLNDPKAGEADGQVYTAWVSPAVSERSKLGKISDALFGDVNAITEYTKADLIGLPIQIVLVPGKKDPNRLNVDVDKLMPADEGQEKIEADAVPDDIPEGGLSEKDLDEVFGAVK